MESSELDLVRGFGAATVPRANGEIVFAAPWESRAFGMAVALRERGVYTWDAFRQRLVERLGGKDGASYYERWLTSLEDVLAANGIASPHELTIRMAEIAEEEE